MEFCDTKSHGIPQNSAKFDEFRNTEFRVIPRNLGRFRIVPDKRSRILEVVIVRRLITWGSGNGRVWEGVEKGEVSLQATWHQGGRILSHLGGFPSK